MVRHASKRWLHMDGINSASIEFSAVVAKVMTMVDGSIRIYLDLPETAISAAAQLMECKRQEIALRVSVKADAV